MTGDALTERQPGLVALVGSGETSPSGGQVFEAVIERFQPPLNVAVLETPAGFEPNSARVAGRVADFLEQRLQNSLPQVSVVPARQRHTAFSPEDPALARSLLSANLIFLGPGSPTYAVRQLRGSRVWNTVIARQQLGAALVLASAAAVAASSWALPVYEIYKAGAKIHWQAGLGLFQPYGLSLVIVPHWNNTEGGADLDTSRCFMGEARFAEMQARLPNEATVLGLDENTSLVFDLEAGQGFVMGRGKVTVIRAGQSQRFGPGERLPLRGLGPFRRLASRPAIPEDVWAEAVAAQTATGMPATEPPSEVITLVDARQAARARHDWAAADALRRQVADLGWKVLDTPDGPQLQPAD